MSLETLKALLPDYAKDLKLNLSSLASETTLTAAAACRHASSSRRSPRASRR